jgi:hypothetical protein
MTLEWDAGMVTGAAVGSLFVVVLAVWCAVRRAARFTKPEDTRTVCGVSRLGIICKLSNICGHPVPLIEAARFSFFPATSGKNDEEGDAASSLAALQDPRAGGITSLEQIIGANRSNRVVVAFSGGATNTIGLARLEFRRMLSQYRELDQLYVLDPTGMSFYEHNIKTFQEQLAACLAPYQKVIFLGNCMGATAALRFSAMLQHPEDTVLAFNPEIDPARDSRRVFRIAACLSPSTTSQLRAVLEKAVADTPARVRIHVSNWPPELDQAMLLLSPSSFSSSSVRHLSKETEANHIDEDGVFDLDYQSYNNAAAAESSPLPRIVRILHRKCNFHGLLAKMLKGNGSLRKILDEAVAAR